MRFHHPAIFTLPEWNGSFTYNGMQYPYVMVGADPSTNQGVIVTTWIIPVKIVVSSGQTFDPLAGGTTSPIARTLLSPIFDTSTTYNQGGVNVGTTQYVDAFQRANFWSKVSLNPGSHLLLGGPASRVRILPELTLNVSAGNGQKYKKLTAPKTFPKIYSTLNRSFWEILDWRTFAGAYPWKEPTHLEFCKDEVFRSGSSDYA